MRSAQGLSHLSTALLRRKEPVQGLVQAVEGVWLQEQVAEAKALSQCSSAGLSAAVALKLVFIARQVQRFRQFELLQEIDGNSDKIAIRNDPDELAVGDNG
jgi:hypothetical protein